LGFQESPLQQYSSDYPDWHHPSAIVCAQNLERKRKEGKKKKVHSTITNPECNFSYVERPFSANKCVDNVDDFQLHTVWCYINS